MTPPISLIFSSSVESLGSSEESRTASILLLLATDEELLLFVVVEVVPKEGSSRVLDAAAATDAVACWWLGDTGSSAVESVDVGIFLTSEDTFYIKIIFVELKLFVKPSHTLNLLNI